MRDEALKMLVVGDDVERKKLSVIAGTPEGNGRCFFNLVASLMPPSIQGPILDPSDDLLSKIQDGKVHIGPIENLENQELFSKNITFLDG
jgi:hypothetical protein